MNLHGGISRCFIEISNNEWGSSIRRVGLLRLDAIAFGGIAFLAYNYFKAYKYFLYVQLVLCVASLLSIYLMLSFYYEYGNFYIDIIGNNLIFLLFSLFGSTLVIISDILIKTKNSLVATCFNFMANISYPIYIFHILFIDLISRNLSFNSYANFITTFIILIFFCYFIRDLIEKPILAKRPKFKTNR